MVPKGTAVSVAKMSTNSNSAWSRMVATKSSCFRGASCFNGELPTGSNAARAKHGSSLRHRCLASSLRVLRSRSLPFRWPILLMTLDRQRAFSLGPLLAQVLQWRSSDQSAERCRTATERDAFTSSALSVLQCSLLQRSLRGTHRRLLPLDC